MRHFVVVIAFLASLLALHQMIGGSMGVGRCRGDPAKAVEIAEGDNGGFGTDLFIVEGDNGGFGTDLFIVEGDNGGFGTDLFIAEGDNGGFGLKYDSG